VGDTARIGDEGKAAERTAPAALLSELSKEQKRHFVLAVTGSGTASHNLHLALDRPPSGCERLSPDFVPVGAFLRDTPKIRFISTKSTEPIRPAAAIVPESGCAVAKDRAGVASQRGDAPAPTTRTMLSKARTGEKAEPPVASSGPAALLSKLPPEQKRHFVPSVTGGGAGLAYFLALACPPSGASATSTKTPTSSPLGLFFSSVTF